MGVLVVICVVIWILAFLIRLGSGDNANTPPKPVAPKINTRVMKNAVDLHINELPQIQTERPSVPAELEQALENAQRVYSLLRLQYAVSSRKTPFLKRMGQETRKRLNLIKSTIRRIKDADSEMDLKIAARDLSAIPGIPAAFSQAFLEKAGSLGVSQAGLQATYNDAIVAMENRDYAKAYKSLIRLGDYKNSREMLKKIKPLVLGEGQSVLFGSWYVNNTGPKSPIEWVVLKREGDRALLISRFVLFCAAFNREPVATDWEHCSLRAWLGAGFFNDAFTSGEQKLIEAVRLKNEQNPVLLTPGCADTVDRVFVLSYREAQEYFRTNTDRLCQPTPYAVTMGVQYSPGMLGYCLWWLRTPGIGREAVSFVAPAKGHVQTGDSETFADFKEGECVLTGQGASIQSGGVRPAMWIRL